MINKIGIQLYSIRDNLTNEEQIRTTFKKLKELGYDEVQTDIYHDLAPQKLYELANEAGLSIIGTHLVYSSLKNNLSAIIEDHKALHTTNVGVGAYLFHSEEEIMGFIKNVNAIAKKLGEHGMKFTYHNHTHEFAKFSGNKSAMDMLLEGLDPENTSFCFDTYWAQYAGCDVCEWLEKMSGRIDILHLKDMLVTQSGTFVGKSTMTSVGNGNINFKKIVPLAEKIGVKHFCVEQDDCPVNFVPSLKMSSDYMHNNFMK